MNDAIGQLDGAEAFALMIVLVLMKLCSLASHSGRRASGVIGHRVQAGEFPVVIAKKYGVQAELLGRMNTGYHPGRLQIGQRCHWICANRPAAGTGESAAVARCACLQWFLATITNAQ